MANEDDKGGFHEFQAAFTAQGMEIAVILEAYEYRCAFTGEDLRPLAATDPLSVLIRLAVDDQPKAILCSDFIPACAEAIDAYDKAHLALGTRFEFLVALDVIDPELLERLLPIGRLRLPANRNFYPNMLAVKAHRQQFSERSSRSD